ncbi:YfdX family protein [Candidatus Nitrospira allomarina]|uniref:YfdX family protein n=1 Tax=Candidatus Nitrospira allomarina TaxID=3020900 RepID=A0AA96JR24_9BACT|nr:YfdX family protein [Candidatus Nitrospira allomarina]WNM56355.1 YfdX family protein [Candidatus Nitrospira allomarina]
MSLHQAIKSLIMGTLVLGVSLGQHLWANETTKKQIANGSTKHEEVASAVQSEVESTGKEEVKKKRKALVKEALNALAETKKALKALEDGNTKDALAALAEVTGQLEIVISRDPHLAFVPVDVEVTTIDIYADLDSIKKAKDQAEDFLQNGEVQQARVLLSGLASELVMTTVSLPLATYPGAIKAVAPLIDQGKIEEAKAALQAVLETLVVTNERVVPLPILRAEAFIKKADDLAKQIETPALIKANSGDERDEAKNSENGKSQKEQVLEQLQNARRQLKMAEALGYGLEEDRYKEFHESIEEIEVKVHGEESPQGIFASLKRSVSQFKRFLFEE